MSLLAALFPPAVIDQAWNFFNANLWTSAMGALLGAASATAFERWKSRKELADARHGALVETQFVLVRRLSSLINLQRKIKMWNFEGAGETLDFRQYHHYSPSASIDVSSIAFLLGDGGGNLMMSFYLVETSFFSAIDSLDKRNAAALEVERSFQEYGPEIGAWQMTPVLTRFLAEARMLPGQIDTALAAHRKLFSEFREECCVRMKGRKFLAIEDIPNESSADPQPPVASQ